MNAPAQPPNDDVPVRPGTVLAGKYRVDRVIGRGGMGIVVEAHHVALDERVALKFLMPEFAQQPEAVERFVREGRAAAKIKGEHVTRVSDVGTLDSGAPYMVMEFLDGIDLAGALQQYGVCQIPNAIDYLLQACEAIAEAHAQGIIHRDLKPANLFLAKRPDGTVMVKVLDFGISKMTGAGVDNLTKTTASMGSALYMSPEQMQTTRGVDHRTDVYALGITLYELLAGKQPYYAETLPTLVAQVLTGEPTPIRQARPDVPEGLAVALEKAYARDREQRYQSIAELAAGLAPYAPARSQNALDRIARMAGLSPAIAGAGQRKTDAPPPDVALGVLAAASYSPAVTDAPGQKITTGVGHIPLLIGGYDGPMSSKAARSFAVGPPLHVLPTSANLSITYARGGSSKTGLLIAMLAVLLVILTGSGVLWLRLRASASPPPAPSASSPEPATTSAAPIAEPSAPAAPTTTASAVVETPPPSAEPSAVPAAPSAAPSAPASAKPKVAPKPSGSSKKPSVMDSR